MKCDSNVELYFVKSCSTNAQRSIRVSIKSESDYFFKHNFALFLHFSADVHLQEPRIKSIDMQINLR